MTGDTSERFVRALAAEHRLRPIVALVDALCDLVGPGDVMCAGCVWETIVKPLVRPLVGWERGCAGREAKDAVPGETGRRPCNMGELMAELDGDELRRTPATTNTERWLRSTEAYDAFTDVLLARLNEADPATGHGIGAVGK